VLDLGTKLREWCVNNPLEYGKLLDPLPADVKKMEILIPQMIALPL
jgi:hypothetical protein